MAALRACISCISCIDPTLHAVSVSSHRHWNRQLPSAKRQCCRRGLQQAQASLAQAPPPSGGQGELVSDAGRAAQPWLRLLNP